MKRKGNTQKKDTTPEKQASYRLFSTDVTALNINDSWLTKVNDFKPPTIFNILSILELFFAQLVSFNTLDTTQAMKSELHKSGMVILNAAPCKMFITALVVAKTIPFSMEFSDDQISERFKRLYNMPGARNSRFKGIIPRPGMSKESLDKYCIGAKYSIYGKLQTYPIYYSTNISSELGINLNTIDKEGVKQISPYPDQVDDAFKFMRDIFERKNPHIVSASNFPLSKLQEQLNIYVETVGSKNVELIDESEAGNPAELERIRAINNAIKNK